MARQPSIDACFTAIDTAIEALEDGELPLEDALKQYEHGLRHIAVARRQLDAIAQRLERLRAEHQQELQILAGEEEDSDAEDADDADEDERG